MGRTGDADLANRVRAGRHPLGDHHLVTRRRRPDPRRQAVGRPPRPPGPRPRGRWGPRRAASSGRRRGRSRRTPHRPGRRPDRTPGRRRGSPAEQGVVAAGDEPGQGAPGGRLGVAVHHRDQRLVGPSGRRAHAEHPPAGRGVVAGVRRRSRVTLTIRTRQAGPGQPPAAVSTQSAAIPSSAPKVPSARTGGPVPACTRRSGQASASSSPRPWAAGRLISRARVPTAETRPSGNQPWAASKPGYGDS